MSLRIFILALALLTSIQEEVSAQGLPPYGGAPVPFVHNEDDDLGILLTILLLAGRNKNSGCGCRQCCSASPQNVLIPFPIPFPTNNPVVNNGYPDSDYDDYEDTPKEKSKDA